MTNSITRRWLRRQPATALWAVMAIAALVALCATELHTPVRHGVVPAIVVIRKLPVHNGQLQDGQMPVPSDPSPVPLR